MKIKSQGFSIINKNKHVQTSDIIDFLIKKSGHEIQRTDYNRQILLEEDGNYYTGLVLTFKNQKKNCLSKINKGLFEIKVEELTGDDKLVSFNFFCLNKKSLKGLYLYYRGSCSLNSLFSTWQTYSNQHFRGLIKNDMVSLGKSPSQAKVDAVNEKYKDRLEFKIIVDTAGLMNMIDSFKEIKSAAFRFDSVDFTESEMIGVESFTRNTEVIFNISDNDKTKVQQVASGIQDLYSNIKGITKGVVTAVDYNKNDRLIDLLNSPCFFQEYEFDELAAHVNGVKNDNFSKNPIVVIIKDEIETGAKKNEFV